MDIESELKQLILSKYKSVLDFAKSISMPYSTIDSIFKRGVQNANITNIIKICNELNISADELANGKIAPAGSSKPIQTSRQAKMELLFNQLDQFQQSQVIGYVERILIESGKNVDEILKQA